MRYIFRYAKGIVAVCIIAGWSTESLADSYTSARNAAFEAFYKYEGLDTYVAQYAAKYEAMLSPSMKKYGGYTLIIARMAVQQKIEFKWTFP